MTGPTIPGMVAKVLVIERRMPAYLQTKYRFVFKSDLLLYVKGKSLEGKERNHLKVLVNPYEGAMSRWLMLKPDEAIPPREEERVRKVIAKT